MVGDGTNGNGSGSADVPTVHLVLQGKGGVGKTVVASWLAEFLIKAGKPVRCIDGDRFAGCDPTSEVGVVGGRLVPALSRPSCCRHG